MSNNLPDGFHMNGMGLVQTSAENLENFKVGIVAVSMHHALTNLKKSFKDSPDKNYTGQQVHQVIESFINHEPKF